MCKCVSKWVCVCMCAGASMCIYTLLHMCSCINATTTVVTLRNEWLIKNLEKEDT